MVKKYGVYVLCFILAGVSFWLYNAQQAAWANYAAEKAKNKILAKADSDKAERIAYYKKLYETEAAKRLDAEMGEDLAVIRAKKSIGDLKVAQDEIAKIKECPDQVIALNFTLTQCRNQYTDTVNSMQKSFDDFKLSCDKTIGDMTKNIGECEGQVTHYSELYAGEVYKRIKYVAKSRRRAAIWLGLGVVAGIVAKSL
ncbi:MAG: hypothetical protein PHC68_16095 [Syntrophorhabdaceae bacterium]|nr:hypothetical protein [Syntrophorhabdaceae bacterium]